MKTRKILAFMLVALMVVSMFAACGEKPVTNPTPTPSASTNESASATPESTPEATTIKGEIVFVHNRTDRNETTFPQYIAKFNEKYPDITVKLETMTDYEGQIKIRMGTADYGDVLLAPTMDPATYADFFIPLGTKDELSKSYRFTDRLEYKGTVYGLAVFGATNGIVYNKRIFKDAGITTLPKSSDEFINALKQIKEKTDAIPLYTNYAAGWPLGGQWESPRGSFTNDPNWQASLAHDDAPWTEGKPHYILAKMLWDVSANGLIEEDPLTTDWEKSKGMLNRGEIACMVLGAWSIGQMQATDVNAADIGYMPMPYVAADGKMYAEAGGDYCMVINKNTKYPEAARAWIDFFINESGFAQDEGCIPTPIDQPFPDSLKDFQDMNVVLYQQNPSPVEEAGLIDKIDSESEIGLWSENFRKRIVEAAALNSGETFEEIINDLNTRWSEARESLGVTP